MENCPRCDSEIAKSKFQMHMEKSHKIIANFKQMTKRSFQPNLAENEIIKEKISKFSEQEDFPKKEINSKSTAKNKKIRKDRGRSICQERKSCGSNEITKGQLISKAIYGVLDSPKKRTKKI